MRKYRLGRQKKKTLQNNSPITSWRRLPVTGTSSRKQLPQTPQGKPPKSPISSAGPGFINSSDICLTPSPRATPAAPSSGAKAAPLLRSSSTSAPQTGSSTCSGIPASSRRTARKSRSPDTIPASSSSTLTTSNRDCRAEADCFGLSCGCTSSNTMR